MTERNIAKYLLTDDFVDMKSDIDFNRCNNNKFVSSCQVFALIQFRESLRWVMLFSFGAIILNVMTLEDAMAARKFIMGFMQGFRESHFSSRNTYR